MDRKKLAEEADKLPEKTKQRIYESFIKEGSLIDQIAEAEGLEILLVTEILSQKIATILS